ncbi:NADH dehydrogenase [ubiquinone] 1 beta subcomplex subunit 2, mitochondrial [Equus asinus]|uniref:NADH dehydrogenase [ubiquinone] 1 beta subcomplex subunit 2, mitochondrial n=1 Tax=Equus asinus TaxID=9793 RepID=UPI0038F75189
MGGATPLASRGGASGGSDVRAAARLGTAVRRRAAMSSLTRVAPFVRLGGRLFLGRRVRAAGGGGVRHAGGDVHIQPRYRQFPQLTRSQVIQAEFFSATMWFWILWRFWHDSDAVLGHFPYPDPSQWTDEELGILPDDED